VADVKILQFVPYFIPYLGGQERYVYNLSRYLVRMGHEVRVVTSNFPKCEEYEVMDGITVERYRCLARPLRNPITPRFLTLNKKIKDYDVVHTHNEHSFAAVVAAYFRRRTDVPLVLTCHGQLKFGNAFSDAFEKIYSKSIGRQVFEKSDQIITLSKSDKQYVSSLGIGSEKIRIIPNVIDINELRDFELDNQGPETLLEPYNLRGKMVILFSGQFIKRKGVEILIKAVPEVLKNTMNSKIVFVFAGTGKIFNNMKWLVKKLKVQDNVVFTGFLGMRELTALYQISDILVQPSLSEGLPTSILEAMYYGVPVIATDIPGIRDHFSEYSLLVPPENQKALVQAIVRLLEDSELREKLSKEGKKLVRRRYSWGDAAKSYVNVYSKLMECVKV
jgi:glycosyltransferase involved in cell wall biosynthesis